MLSILFILFSISYGFIPMLIVTLSLIASFLGLGYLIFIHELGHFSLAKLFKVGVKEFAIGFGKKLWSFKRKETEYSLRAIPLGGFVNMEGLECEAEDPEKSYAKKPKYARFLILVAGVLYNFLFALLALSIVYMHGVKAFAPEIQVTDEKLPAAEYLVKGDEIISINGVEIKSWKDVSKELDKNTSGNPVQIVVIRENDIKSFEIQPVKIKTEDMLGGEIEKWVLGIAPTGKRILLDGMNPADAFIESVKFSKDMYVLTFVAIGKIFTKEAKAEKTLGGPVLIVSLMSMSVTDGFFSFLYILAIVSLALAIMNSLPIPVLDGGHIMFLGLEAIGLPVSQKIQVMLQNIFVIALILLMIFVVFLDVQKIIDWFF